ncbi:hypothetical protein EJB05_24535, partial [Eragrostis curvula]
MERVEMMTANARCFDLVEPKPDMEHAARSNEAERTEMGRARLMLKNLELDEEEMKAHAGSKAEKPKKKLLPKPVPRQFSVAGDGKKRKKMLRVGKEFVDCIAGIPHPPPFQSYPSSDVQFMEIQESYVAKERAIREEHERIIKQYEVHGYAEIEVTDDEEEV